MIATLCVALRTTPEQIRDMSVGEVHDIVTHLKELNKTD